MFLLKSSIIFNQQVKAVSKLGLSLTMGLLLTLMSVATYAGYQVGYVFTRGLVLNDNDKPVWVTYDSNGKVVAELGEASGLLDPANWWTLSGERYRSFEAVYSSLKTQYPTLGLPISKDSYYGMSFSDINGNVIPRPALSDNTAYVSVLPQEARLIASASQLILAQYEINPSQPVASNIVSMLVNKAGATKLQSTYRIGFKTNVIGDNESANFTRKFGDEIHGPVPDVLIEGMMGAKGSSDVEGKYGLSWASIPCPLYGYTIDGTIMATLYSRRFNPGGRGPRLYYILRHTSESCTPNSYVVPFIGPMALGGGFHQTNPAVIDFPLDIMVLSGVGVISGAPVVENTQYTTSDRVLGWQLPGQGQDIDKDTISDIIKIGSFEYDAASDTQTFVEASAPADGNYAGLVQGVYLSSTNTDPSTQNPDFTVRIQQQNNTQNEGLLSGISKADLRNTDLYVFRMADNKLISERIGLSEPESETDTADIGVNATESTFYYRMEMAGERGNYLRYGLDPLDGTIGYTRSIDYGKYQARSGMNPELYAQEADHLRPGDRIRIVAINRSTGYMGSTYTRMSSVGSGGLGADLSWDISPIIMHPPNLKVWVERKYDVKSALASGDLKREQIIGYEGAGLTSDEFLTVYTEWLDIDGSPLPETLSDAGFTGRIANLVADKSLGGNGSVHQFDIKPGKQLQVLQFPQGGLNAQHFYIQVSGEPSHGNPIFSNNNRVGAPDFTAGSQTGALAGRPDRYTPFMVPIPNEAASKQLLDLYYKELALNPETTLKKPEPYYEWRFRPEMQFSLYDLKIKELKLETTYDEGSSTKLNVVYDLSTTTYDPLSSFQREREIIIDVAQRTDGGEQIAVVNAYGDTTVQIENLELLQYFNGGELLSLQLASRNDVLNPLYEYSDLPLLLGQATPVSLSRNQSLGAYDADVNNSGLSDVTDTFVIPGFYLTQDATVKLELLDADKKPVSIVPLAEDKLFQGDNYSFIVSYTDIAAYINPQAGVDFYLQVHAKVANEPLEHKIIMPGNLSQDVSSEMLGQVIEHDTLIQRGSVSISKQDLKLAGLGPDLSFIRSYSNEQRKEVGSKPMGPGWSHNHNIFMQVISKGDDRPLGQYNLPAWVIDNRPGSAPAFVRSSTLPKDNINNDRQILISNGGMFKLEAGIWHSQRGRHGRLTHVPAEIDVNTGAPLTLPHYEYSSKDGTRYVFGDINYATGKAYVQQVIDTSGNALTYSYEPDTLGGLTILGSNRLQSISDSVGRSLTFNYLEQISGKTRLDNVECDCGTDSITLNFTYEDYDVADTYFHENASVLKSVNRDTQTETYDYAFNTVADNVVNLKTVTDPNGEVTTYNYLAPANTLLDQLRFYAKGLTKYDAVESVQYPGNVSATLDYQVATANKRSVTDLNGNTKQYTFNTFGNPSQIDSPLGHTAKMTWTIDQGLNDNVVTSRTDEFGNTTSYEYDAQGNVTKETDPYGNFITQTWDPTFSVLLTRTDKNGNQFRQEIDPVTGNVDDEYQTATVNGLLTETHRHHTYNVLGQRDSTTDARGNITEYGYDTWGLLNRVTEIYPGGNLITSYVNDARGRRRSKTDPRGKITTYDYDELDRLELTTDPEGNTTLNGYDFKGNKTSETITDTYLVDGVLNTRVTTLTYFYEDGRDRVTKVTRTSSLAGSAIDNAGGQKLFTYDDNGNLKTETDWKGNLTEHFYDALNRRERTINRTLVDDMSIDYAFIPNTGLRKTMTDYEGRVSVEHYDKLNRLSRVDLPTVTNYDGTTNSYFKQYTYNNSTNVLTSRDANGNVTTFEYDGRYLKTKRINALTGEYVWKYDANGNLKETTDEENRLTSYVYDELNRLTNKTEAENHNWIYGYDDSGNMNTVTDPWGYVTTTLYDGVNQPVSITTPDGLETVAYTRDGQKVFHRDTELRTTTNIVGVDSRLVKQIDGVGRTTTFVYDDNNNLTDTQTTWVGAISGATSSATHNTFDVLDRLDTKTEAFGSVIARTINYDYDKLGNVKVETRPDLRITQFDYDQLNRQIRITDADSQSIQQKYDGVGNLLETLDRRGHKNSTTYDVLNRADIMTDARLQTMDYDYDGVGNLTGEVDKRGTRTTHVYDDLNRLISSSKPKENPGADIRLVFNEYDLQPAGTSPRQDRITDANNNVVTTTYNWRGQTTRVDYPAGQGYLASYSTSIYDNSGFKTSDTDENLHVTNYTYYNDGSVNTITNALLETTTYEYDLFGNQASVTRPKTNATRYAYDELNRLKEITNALSQLTTYEYDSNDNITHQYTPDSGSGTASHVEYTYDVLNRRDLHIQHKATGNLTVDYGYDFEGNLTSTLDAKGQLFERTYDELNRLENQIYPVGSDLSLINSTYDANNNVDVITETKPTGIEITDNNYDLLDRLKQTAQRGHVVAYDYDDNGNRTLVSSPRGSTTYTFDGRNRLATAFPTGSPAQATTYNYQANGWKTSIIKANGTSSTYTQDVVGRTDIVTHTAADASVISSFDYDYDTNGNRDKQTEIQNGFAANKQQVTDYVYDTLDRMESYTVTDTETGNTTETVYTFHPSYDRATEVVTETIAAVPTVIENRSYTYDETNWLQTITDVPSTNTIDYDYDANGNTKTKVDNIQAIPEYLTFTYNSRNQLVETIRGPPASEVSQGTYAYNYRGMRIRHLGSERGDIEYIYDDQAIIDEVQNNTNTLVAHYRYADKLLSLTTPTDTQYYHFAALGTTANLSDGSGVNQTAYRVDPYGEITHQEGVSVNRQVFTGQEHDENTGLIYFGARYYDPDSARFLTQDSYLGEPGTAPSLHRYLYAYGNPTVYFDPDGNITWMANLRDELSGYADKTTESVGQLDGHDMTDRIVGGAASVGAGVADVAAAGVSAVNYVSNWVSMATGGFGNDEWGEEHAKEISGTHDVAQAAYTAVSTDEGRAKIKQGMSEGYDAWMAGDMTAMSKMTRGFTAVGVSGGTGGVSTKVAAVATNVAKTAAKATAKITMEAATKGAAVVKKALAQVKKNASAYSPGPLARQAGVIGDPRKAGFMQGGGNSARGVKVEKHGILKNDSTIPGQSHHINQNAAYRDVIPENEAVAIKLEGNAFTEVGSAHYSAHKSLEGFWNKYRRGGSSYGDVPSNRDYTKAMYQSLRDAGKSHADAMKASKAAIKQRRDYGLKGNDLVPRIPGRINQRQHK